MLGRACDCQRVLCEGVCVCVTIRQVDTCGAGAILLRAVESPWGCSEGQWAAKRVNSTCICVCRDGAVLEGCAGMRENKHGTGCGPAWNKVWGSVPHSSLPARVCVKSLRVSP